MANEIIVEATREILLGTSPEQVTAIAVIAGMLLGSYLYLKAWQEKKNLRRSLYRDHS